MPINIIPEEKLKVAAPTDDIITHLRQQIANLEIHGRASSYIIAPYNALTRSRDGADKILRGVADHLEINGVIGLTPAYGMGISILDGRIVTTSALNFPAQGWEGYYLALTGQGRGTMIDYNGNDYAIKFPGLPTSNATTCTEHILEKLTLFAYLGTTGGLINMEYTSFCIFRDLWLGGCVGGASLRIGCACYHNTFQSIWGGRNSSNYNHKYGLIVDIGVVEVGTITGTFTQWETITGQTSGATGTMAYAYYVAPNQHLYVTNISGTFVVGETALGALSGATIVLTAVGGGSSSSNQFFNCGFDGTEIGIHLKSGRMNHFYGGGASASAGKPAILIDKDSRFNYFGFMRQEGGTIVINSNDNIFEGVLGGAPRFGEVELTGTVSGAFTYNETVTGGTSGATGKFLYQDNGHIYLATVVGVFQTGENAAGAAETISNITAVTNLTPFGNTFIKCNFSGIVFDCPTSTTWIPKEQVYEAEDSRNYTTGAIVADANASNGKAVALSAVDPVGSHYVRTRWSSTEHYAIPRGKYLVLVRAKATAAVADDLRIVAMDEWGGNILAQQYITTVGDSTYRIYPMLVTFGSTCIGKASLVYASKSQAGANTITVDYIKLIRLGHDLEDQTEMPVLKNCAKPPADADMRGIVNITLGGAGVRDAVVTCKKQADDSYVWADANSGTATVPNGATTVAVNHLLATTPTRVLLTARGWGTAWRVWVSGIGATQFTINVDSDPGASTAIFDWRAQVGEG